MKGIHCICKSTLSLIHFCLDCICIVINCLCICKSIFKCLFCIRVIYILIQIFQDLFCLLNFILQFCLICCLNLPECSADRHIRSRHSKCIYAGFFIHYRLNSASVLRFHTDRDKFIFLIYIRSKGNGLSFLRFQAARNNRSAFTALQHDIV